MGGKRLLISLKIKERGLQDVENELNQKLQKKSFEVSYYEQAVKLFKSISDVEKNKLVRSINTILGEVDNSKIIEIEELLFFSSSRIERVCLEISRNIDLKQFYKQEIYKSTKESSKNLKGHYKKLYDCYSKLIGKKINSERKLNVALVEHFEITTCPYCNRNYINSRSEKHAGAQLDHFYCRSKFPMFSVSLYNLVPSCGTCNHRKLDCFFYYSPFSNVKIDPPRFKMNSSRDGLLIDCDNPDYNFQLEQLGIREAYSIHDQDVRELERRARIYDTTKIKELEGIIGEGIDSLTLESFVFGSLYLEDDDKTRSLSKFRREIVADILEDRKYAASPPKRK